MCTFVVDCTTGKKATDDMSATVDEALSETSRLALEMARLVNENSMRISAGPFAWAVIVPVFAIAGIVLMKINQQQQEMQYVPLGSVLSNPNLSGNVNVLNASGKMGSRSVACAWSCTFFLGMISCILAAIFMPVAQVFADVCYAVDDYPLKMSQSIESDGPDILGKFKIGVALFLLRQLVC